MMVPDLPPDGISAEPSRPTPPTRPVEGEAGAAMDLPRLRKKPPAPATSLRVAKIGGFVVSLVAAALAGREWGHWEMRQAHQNKPPATAGAPDQVLLPFDINAPELKRFFDEHAWRKEIQRPLDEIGDLDVEITLNRVHRGDPRLKKALEEVRRLEAMLQKDEQIVERFRTQLPRLPAESPDRMMMRAKLDGVQDKIADRLSDLKARQRRLQQFVEEMREDPKPMEEGRQFDLRMRDVPGERAGFREDRALFDAEFMRPNFEDMRLGFQPGDISGVHLALPPELQEFPLPERHPLPVKKDAPRR